MTMNLDTRDRIYIARQPILHSSGRVFGYELLYRHEAGDTSCQEAGDLAGARVLTDAFLNVLDPRRQPNRSVLNARQGRIKRLG